MLQYQVSEYMPEIRCLNLAKASFNELQDDVPMWDWAMTHLGMIAHKLGHVSEWTTLRAFHEEYCPSEPWSIFMNREGGALEFVEWILDTERLFS